MSSKIVINISTEAVSDEVMINGKSAEESTSPIPPDAEAMDLMGGMDSGVSSFAASEHAPAPPAGMPGDGHHEQDDFTEGAGPPDFMSDTSTAGMSEAISDSPMPPSDHPDVAGDNTGIAMTRSAASPAPAPPPGDSGEEDEGSGPDSSKKGKKGSGGKKKK